MANKKTNESVARTQSTSQDLAPNQYTFTPCVDIWETGEDYRLELEMPGVDATGVDVQLEDGVLNVVGRVAPMNYEGYNRTYSEYEVGNYERSFTVANEIDAEKIQATIKNGVLSLILPKREAVKPRRIEVAVG
jgi:HSP20 family molecular chaperone IbpA